MKFEKLGASESWHALVDAARRAAEDLGYEMKRVPGKGLANIWEMAKGGKTKRVSIRTTKNRWFTFLPLDGAKKWKTLDEVDLVLVAATDSKEDPKAVEVFLFPSDKVRARFNEAYKARVKAGHKVKDDFGFWVLLDLDKRDIASSVGSGLAEEFKPVKVYPISDFIDEDEVPASNASPTRSDVKEPASIADVMGWARERIAQLAGVRVEAVKLDLKVEY